MKVPHIPFSSMFREIGRNAFVDWLLILVLNTIIVLALALGGIYLYWQISIENFTSSFSVNKKEDKIFNEKNLSDVIDYFQVREDNSKLIKGGYRGIGDPSL